MRTCFTTAYSNIEDEIVKAEYLRRVKPVWEMFATQQASNTNSYMPGSPTSDDHPLCICKGQDASSCRLGPDQSVQNNLGILMSTHTRSLSSVLGPEAADSNCSGL